MKIGLGILTGILICFLLLFGYRKVINPYYTLLIPKFAVDTSRKISPQEDVISLKNETLGLEEKISSTNKRMDDFLVFGGIIITLLLAINIGVYINTDRQVDRHLKENFEKHREKVEKYLSEVEEMAGKVQAELELAQSHRKKFESLQTPT